MKYLVVFAAAILVLGCVGVKKQAKNQTQHTIDSGNTQKDAKKNQQISTDKKAAEKQSNQAKDGKEESAKDKEDNQEVKNKEYNQDEVGRSGSEDTNVVGSTDMVEETASKSVYECVKASGFNPDSFIFAYTSVCGEKWVSTANTASRRTGLQLLKINVGLVKENEKALLDCFYSRGGNGGEPWSCNMLYCPNTGDTAKLSPQRPASRQFRSFALKCKSG